MHPIWQTAQSYMECGDAFGLVSHKVLLATRHPTAYSLQPIYATSEEDFKPSALDTMLLSLQCIPGLHRSPGLRDAFDCRDYSAPIHRYGYPLPRLRQRNPGLNTQCLGSDM
jgi:hypothetical protein